MVGFTDLNKPLKGRERRFSILPSHTLNDHADAANETIARSPVDVAGDEGLGKLLYAGAFGGKLRTTGLLQVSLHPVGVDMRVPQDRTQGLEVFLNSCIEGLSERL